MDFEWDRAKAASNLRKHGVSFEEAKTVFDDPRVLSLPDEAHSDDEERAHAIGISHKGRLLLVSFTDRPPAIRIISARKAGRSEVNAYGET